MTGACYIKLRNMDGRDTLKSIPRTIITDLKGNVAGSLAELGADIVRGEISRLPEFLLMRVTETSDGYVSELPRFLAVPTTGWCQLDNGQWVFVLPHTTKFSKDLARVRGLSERQPASAVRHLDRGRSRRMARTDRGTVRAQQQRDPRRRADARGPAHELGRCSAGDVPHLVHSRNTASRSLRQ